MSANPSSYRRLASVSINVSLVSSNSFTNEVEVNSSFFFRNASSCSWSHTHATSLFMSGCRGLVMCAKLGMHILSWFTRPMNPLRSRRFLGSGNWAVATNFSLSGPYPSAEIIWPVNLILLLSSSFFCDIVMLFSLQRERTILALSRSSDSVSAQMSVSSTIFRAQDFLTYYLVWAEFWRVCPCQHAIPWIFDGF